MSRPNTKLCDLPGGKFFEEGLGVAVSGCRVLPDSAITLTIRGRMDFWI